MCGRSDFWQNIYTNSVPGSRCTLVAYCVGFFLDYIGDLFGLAPLAAWCGT